MASTPSDESKRLEDVPDSQEAIDEVERAQVAKRWTRAMMRFGVEARGQRKQESSVWQFKIRVLNPSFQVSSQSYLNTERIHNTARYFLSGSP